MNYFLKLNILNFNNEKIFKLAYSSIVNIGYMLSGVPRLFVAIK
jgi:NADH:ubiquinone oxidoreductase subunit 2 (subunit N)